jgi:DNA-binding NtrC family response regulator
MLELAPVRRVLIVDPCDACYSLLPELGAQGWQVETCSLGAATDISCDVGILRLRPFHLEWPQEIQALISGSTAQWLAIVDPEVLRQQDVGNFICQLFFEFLTLPVELHLLLGALERGAGGPASAAVSDCAGSEEDCDLVGESRAVRDLRRLLGKFASTESAVLIRGESGTGKERAARRLHRQSSRRAQPFVTFYCAPMSVQTLHRELFGFDRGMFISAPEGMLGRLEQAQGGTLFLDTVEALPLETQARLLACLQEKRFHRVGSHTPLDLDVRVLAASSADLESAVAQGLFRDDLFYRLNVLQVETTPLRERHGDLALLAHHFARRYSKEIGAKMLGFSENALVAMARHPWPGNVRELSNRVRRAVILAQGRHIASADLGLHNVEGAKALMGTLEDYKHRAERQALCDVLNQHSDNLSAAAKVLGISRPTFYRLLHKHQMR